MRPIGLPSLSVTVAVVVPPWCWTSFLERGPGVEELPQPGGTYMGYDGPVSRTDYGDASGYSTVQTEQSCRGPVLR